MIRGIAETACITVCPSAVREENEEEEEACSSCH